MRAAFRPGHTRMIWAETPTNPLLSIADIAALAGLAHEYDALLVVDNTFASPYLQQPLGLGADVVVHSTTKYLGGHSDVVGGALVAGGRRAGRGARVPPERDGRDQRPVRRLADPARHQTLGVRMDRHCDNAERIAAFLAGHPAVAQVLYPGLQTHPGHEIAAKQMRRFGGMVSLPRGRRRRGRRVEICNRTKTVRARRVTRRRRVADRASRAG